jgi:hypothetical protein
MQFLPSTWSVVGVDADRDGVRSPHDIEDAALSAAVFLCSAPGSLDTPTGLRTAILRYNPSSAYVASVLAVERSYRAGEFATPGEVTQVDPFEVLAVPSGDSPVAAAAPDDRSTPSAHRSSRAAAGADRHDADPADGPRTRGPGPSATPDPDPSPTGTTDPTGTPSPDPTDTPSPDPTDTPSPSPTETPDPTATPDPTPSPSPEPDPEFVELTGVLSLSTCLEGYWCLDESLPLAVGDASVPASADFDGNGAVETNGEELNGLVNTVATVLVVHGTSPAVVVSINGVGYGS